jgi:putative ABC transport system permease protein
VPAVFAGMYHLRHAVRTLIKQPAPTLLAVAMLAVGLAFNVASTSLLSALLRRPYPFPAIDELVIIRDRRPLDGVHQRRPIASGDYVDLRREARAFSAMAGYRPVTVVVGGPGEPAAVQGAAVAANFFELLGVRTSLGRGFAAHEDQPGTDAVVLFTRRFWQAHFGADPHIIGREIPVNGRTTTVIGIVPDEQAYPAGINAWVPLVLSAQEREERTIQRVTGIARMKVNGAGVSSAVAADDLLRVAGDLAARYPATNRGRAFDLQLLRREQYEFTAPLFLLLQAAATLVLSLAIANVANLFVARTLDRRHELAIRAALGGSRRHVFALLLTEAVITAGLSGVLAAPIAFWLIRMIRAAVPADIAKWIAGWNSIAMDGPTMIAAVLLTCATGAMLGVVTGLRATSVAAASSPHGAGRAIVPGTGWPRRLLVAGQLAIAVLLLVTAAVTLQGFRRLAAAFEQLRPASLAAFTLALPAWRYPDDGRIVEFHDRLLAGLRESTAVESAGLIRNAPASNVPSPTILVAVIGRPSTSPSDALSADLQIVTGDTFRTLAVDIVAGRALSSRDGPDAPRVAVVSRAMARRVWPGSDPRTAVGAVIKLGLDPAVPGITVVGVAADLRLNWYDPEPRSVIYLPDAQSPARQATVLIRTTTNPHALAGAVRALLRRLDPLQPVTPVRPLTQEIDESIAPVRMIGLLLVGMSAVAILLAAAGIYAVLAQWVAARRMELGLRLALGADAASLRQMILRETIMMALAGVGAGAPLAVLATAAAGTAALGLRSADPATIAVVAAFAFAVAVASSAIPAARAAATDPARLLRSE